MRRSLLALKWVMILSFALVHPAFADSRWNEWSEAKESYDRQEYSLALQEFLKHPQNDATYHYNLGNVFFRLGKKGAALAHFEKANRMHPHDPDIQHNLNLVRLALSQEHGSASLDPASHWAEKISDRLSLDEVRTALGVLGLSVILLWARAYWKSRRIRQALIYPSCIFAFFGFLVFAGLYGIQRWGNTHPPAISLQDHSIRSGPGERYIELIRAEEGAKTRVLQTAPGSSNSKEVWYQVRYSDEGVGWVKDSDLLVL